MRRVTGLFQKSAYCTSQAGLPISIVILVVSLSLFSSCDNESGRQSNEGLSTTEAQTTKAATTAENQSAKETTNNVQEESNPLSQFAAMYGSAAVPSALTGQQCVSAQTYCDNRYGFLINWPNNSWKVRQDPPSDQTSSFGLDENITVPVILTKGTGSPQLSVVVGVGAVSQNQQDIEAWIKKFQQTLSSQARMYQSVDSQSNSALIVVSTSQDVFAERVVINGGRIYQVTSNKQEISALSDQDQSDLGYILSSFRLLSAS